MNTSTAATQAGVTVSTVRTWCRRNVIAAVKVAGRWVIDATSLAYRASLTPKAPANRTSAYIDELNMQIFDLVERHSLTGLSDLLTLVRKRDTQTVASIPSEQVRLTDDQWRKIERSVSFQVACVRAEH